MQNKIPTTMKEEILAAVMFLIRFVEKNEKVPRDQIESFKTHLTTLLMQRFEKHWFPEIPTRGQGYRCIRVNGLTPIDKSILKAASRCGLSYKDLSLPTELTVWVDPNEVCYRLGESEGSYCTLATFTSESSDSCSSTSSPLSSPPGTPVQEKSRRILQARQPQQHQPHPRVLSDGPSRNRHFSFNGNGHLVPPVRTKPMFREMGFNYQNRSPMRCDPAPFSVPPTFYRNYNNYNTRQYKNVVKV